jgi:predicted choloylglycine hydrolase
MGGSYPDICVVSVRGKPYEMGRQHGEKLACLMRQALDSTNAGFEVSARDPSTDQLDRLTKGHKEITTRLRPELFEELEGVANGAGVNYNRVVEMFLARELPYGFAQPRHTTTYVTEECTAWGAVGEATADAEPMLAQNRDCPYDSGQYRIVIVAQPSNGHSFVATGRVGCNDGYGVNKKGLAIMAPAVRPLDSIDACKQERPPGIQSYTLARMVLEACESVDAAIDLIKSTPPGYMGLNWLLVDRDNQMARIERSYSKLHVTYPEEAAYSTNKVTAATNHYPSREMSALSPQSIEPSTKKRYDRIATLLATNAGKIDFNSFVQFARDHGNGHNNLSICNHGEESGTNLSMIAQCAQSRLWVLRGSPCLNEYVSYDCL